ncbi:TPA: hypothetical protein JG812_003956 [Vibrio parahaemolyticus]|uniref:hypothetical protein n=1 Tax=Vibrio parahaemolyticus TaxID=670 RepID=UPI000676F965|nr:hypothetical protein [Vibrio parahaemolyticus]EJE3288488.1 hypothetical protein [Vibrio alginolyticus]MEA3484114.1 hypothetical protein [Pseudomonadota bacterium]EGR2744416.1 hypothetical protein [Vibrio parahaemolyticus]EGR2875316.1 hypothetical protein [Vibrio parahaemolyticus]EJC7067029.1 hypothetical protein [Vibrio parahaemolyticus]
MSKREAREAKKLEKRAKQKQKAVKLVEALVLEDIARVPRIQFMPDIEKMPLTQASLEDLDVPKQPKTNVSGSRFGYKMTWCARKADLDGKWVWGEERIWSEQEWSNVICSAMNSLQGSDWSEIQKMTSDTGHLMHHEHDISDLCDAAVERWIELELDQFDTPFRFRLGNKKRAWGIELQGHFYMIWYEREHKIYPV